MFNLILQRLFTAIPVLLAVITVTFVMVHSAPGGPFDEDKAVSPEVMEKLNERYNLNAPLLEQFIPQRLRRCSSIVIAVLQLLARLDIIRSSL